MDRHCDGAEAGGGFRGGRQIKEASHLSLHAEKPFRFRIWILKQDGRDYYFLACIEDGHDK